MEFWKRHDTTDTTDFCQRQLLRICCGLECYGEVANLLRICYGETDVMEFGHNTAKRQYGGTVRQY